MINFKANEYPHAKATLIASKPIMPPFTVIGDWAIPQFHNHIIP